MMRDYLLIGLLVCGLVTVVAIAGISLADDTARRGLVLPEANQPKGFPAPGAVGNIVIKEYPVYRAARVSAQEAGRNGMFRTLFQHIKRNDIAMTAPVEMTYGERGPETMAFLYDQPTIGRIGEDNSVDVVDLPKMSVVSIAVRGSYTQKRFNDARSKLTEWLADQEDWKAAGPARFLAFNSPFVPGLLKFGEVQIPVTKAAPIK